MDVGCVLLVVKFSKHNPAKTSQIHTTLFSQLGMYSMYWRKHAICNLIPLVDEARSRVRVRIRIGFQIWGRVRGRGRGRGRGRSGGRG